MIDCRELGCGYDFKIQTGSEIIYVEIKGMVDADDGITLTDKEWRTAKEKRGQYYLIIVRNVHSTPLVQVIQNPSKFLEPNKSMFVTLQVRWGVSNKQLQAKLENKWL